MIAHFYLGNVMTWLDCNALDAVFEANIFDVAEHIGGRTGKFSSIKPWGMSDVTRKKISSSTIPS